MDFWTKFLLFQLDVNVGEGEHVPKNCKKLKFLESSPAPGPTISPSNPLQSTSSPMSSLRSGTMPISTFMQKNSILIPHGQSSYQEKSASLLLLIYNLFLLLRMKLWKTWYKLWTHDTLCLQGLISVRLLFHLFITRCENELVEKFKMPVPFLWRLMGGQVARQCRTQL